MRVVVRTLGLEAKCLWTDWTETCRTGTWSLGESRPPPASRPGAVQTTGRCRAAWCNRRSVRWRRRKSARWGPSVLTACWRVVSKPPDLQRRSDSGECCHSWATEGGRPGIKGGRNTKLLLLWSSLLLRNMHSVVSRTHQDLTVLLFVNVLITEHVTGAGDGQFTRLLWDKWHVSH